MVEKKKTRMRKRNIEQFGVAKLHIELTLDCSSPFSASSESRKVSSSRAKKCMLELKKDSSSSSYYYYHYYYFMKKVMLEKKKGHM